MFKYMEELARAIITLWLQVVGGMLIALAFLSPVWLGFLIIAWMFS